MARPEFSAIPFSCHYCGFCCSVRYRSPRAETPPRFPGSSKERPLPQSARSTSGLRCCCGGAIDYVEERPSVFVPAAFDLAGGGGRIGPHHSHRRFLHLRPFWRHELRRQRDAQPAEREQRRRLCSLLIGAPLLPGTPAPVSPGHPQAVREQRCHRRHLQCRLRARLLERKEHHRKPRTRHRRRHRQRISGMLDQPFRGLPSAGSSAEPSALPFSLAPDLYSSWCLPPSTETGNPLH
jgi:hypothetical protein